MPGAQDENCRPCSQGWRERFRSGGTARRPHGSLHIVLAGTADRRHTSRSPDTILQTTCGGERPSGDSRSLDAGSGTGRPEQGGGDRCRRGDLSDRRSAPVKSRSSPLPDCPSISACRLSGARQSIVTPRSTMGVMRSGDVAQGNSRPRLPMPVSGRASMGTPPPSAGSARCGGSGSKPSASTASASRDRSSTFTVNTASGSRRSSEVCAAGHVASRIFTGAMSDQPASIFGRK